MLRGASLTFIYHLIVAEKFAVDGGNALIHIIVFDGDDDVERGRALVYHFDVNARVGKRLEEAGRSAYRRRHTVTDGGDEGDIFADAHKVGLDFGLDAL